MSIEYILPDILVPNLKLVICGTAASTDSADVGSYYAGKNNMFWKILYETGLTSRVLLTSEFNTLLQYRIGLTDIAKHVAGVDSEINDEAYDAKIFVNKMRVIRPSVICFNGKKAAALLCGWQHDRKCKTAEIKYGVYPYPLIPCTIIFVAPSTSAAARKYWQPAIWHDLARLVQSLS